MSLSQQGLYRFEEFELDCGRRALLRAGEPVVLSPKAFDVLTYLVLNPARVVTKEELLKAVWPESFVEEGNLAQHISSVRRALGDRSGYIVTVPGRGYQFTAKVQTPAALEELPRMDGGEVVVQRVRERTRVVVEETSSPEEYVLAGEAGTLGLPGRQSGIKYWVFGALVAGAVVVAAVAIWIRYFSVPSQLPKVMVADFLNVTGDPEFDNTLKTALAIGVGQSPYVQLMGKGEEHTTLTMMEKAVDTPLLGETAVEVCRRGGYQALLQGRIENAGGGYELSMEVLNCASGKAVTTFKAVARDKDRVLDVLDQLAARARRKVGETRESIGQFGVPMREATTFSFEALKDYDIGSDLGNAGKLQECVEYFKKAVELDPKFALAQASLGTAYYDLGSGDTATGYYQKAFELSGNVTEAEKLYIRSNYYLTAVRDVDAAAKIFEEQTQFYPTNEMGWVALANADTQLGKFSEAIAAGEHALKYGVSRPEVSYEDLARAYKRANRYADAKRTIAAAQAQGKDDQDFHDLLFDIAVIEQDQQTIRREVDGNKDKPGFHASLESQAIYAADQGRYKQTEELFGKAIAEAEKEVGAENANAVLLDEAGIELELGRVEKAKELLREVKDKNSANFAVFAAKAGDPSVAETYLKLSMMYPHETTALFLYRPEMKALIALHRGDAAGAVKELEISEPYELVRPEVIDVRGQAYLAAHDGVRAQVEYQKLIDHPALEDPTLPRTYLAHVGLARAYALQGKTAESKGEYEKFFALWRDAEPDVPVLQQAKVEYARLQ